MSLLSRQTDLLAPGVANAVLSSQPRDDEIIERAQDGAPINGLVLARRAVYFHSRYSPGREAERLAATVAPGSLVVVVGLGMGHHVREIAHAAELQIVIEPDPALVRSALAREDFSQLLVSGRLRVLTDESLAHLLEEISHEYIPAVHRTLSVVTLPGRIQAEPHRMNTLLDTLTRALEHLQNDLAVQVRFGHQWTRNAILNLPHVKPAPLPTWTDERVTVCAAGPSLEDFCASFDRSRAGRIVSVDSALPVLIENRIEPDLVVTIDCQVATYHHFLLPRTSSAPVVADLSVSPAAFRASESVIAGLSSHPLHLLIGALGLELPYLDVRGGNVAQAAVDVAVRTGGAHVELVGADFSFPDGRTYARGSYIDRHFQIRASRTAPLTTHHYRFLVDRPGLYADPGSRARLRQPLLDTYAARMADYVATVPADFTRVQGPGVALPPPDPAHATVFRPTRAIPPRERRSPTAILSRIHDLVAAQTSIRALLRSRAASGVEALAAHALLPLLTQLRSEDAASSADALLARAREQTLSLIRLARNHH